MKSKTDQKPAAKKETQANNNAGKNGGGAHSSAPSASAPATSKGKFTQVAPQRKNPHGIPDYRLEVPNFQTVDAYVCAFIDNEERKICHTRF